MHFIFNPCQYCVYIIVSLIFYQLFYQIYFVESVKFRMIRHGMFQNFAIMLLQIRCGWLPTKCAICLVLKSTRIKVNNEYYKYYDEPGLRENIFLKSKSSLRYAKIVSRLRNRKSYFQLRFVCFKWTSSLAEDIVKRLLIQWYQNEQLSGEVENGSLDPVVSTITTQMPLKFFVHYCFKWTIKVFLWTTQSIFVVSKRERPFFLFAHQSTTGR